MKGAAQQVIELTGSTGIRIVFFMDHIVAFGPKPGGERGSWIITSAGDSDWHVTESYKEILTIMERFGS